MGGYADDFPLLSALGLYAADIRGDGNCLFNALSDQIYGHQNEHPTIRSRVIDYMREHADYYKQFLDVYPGGGTRRNPKRKTTGAYSSPVNVGRPTQEDVDRVFDQHLQTMARGGTWGDNMEIQAFSSAFEVDVKIYQRDFAYMIQANESTQARPVAHIAYHTWEHYSSIRNLDGPHTGMPDVKEKLLSAAEEQSQRQHLLNTSPIQPWMINQLQSTLPYALDRATATRVLEETKGNLNLAYDRLLDGSDAGSASSTQESSSIEREADSDDESIHGPNKKQDRRMSRSTRHKLPLTSHHAPAHSRLNPIDAMSDPDSADSAESDLFSADARSGTQDSLITETDTINVRSDVADSKPKRPIRIKLNGPRQPPPTSAAEETGAKTRQKQPGPKRITARDKKDMKKLAQKAARKERQQQAGAGGEMGVAAEKMKAGIGLRSQVSKGTPPIESGFRTLFI